MRVGEQALYLAKFKGDAQKMNENKLKLVESFEHWRLVGIKE